MAEYIEREKAIECIKPHVKVQTVYGEAYMQAIAHAVDILEIMPTADVQPVKRGKWLHFHDDGIIFCSECEREAYWDSDGQQLFDYCPYCGAQMLTKG